MRNTCWLKVSCLALLALLPAAWAQPRQQRPYVGFVYPAGGQQGTTFRIRMGGQDIPKVNDILVSGRGVTVKFVDYHRWLGNQEIRVLLEQLQQLDPNGHAGTAGMTDAEATKHYQRIVRKHLAHLKEVETDTGPAGGDSMATRLEKRIVAHVPRPACRSIANLVFADVTIAPDARPGEREIRVVTPNGVSNPLVFCVGQVKEFTCKPLATCPVQVPGKEEQALRKRPAVENRMTLPCTINGQMASGEVNRFRFFSRKGQKLVITALGRELIPYIADAVPGWLQPVLRLYDSKGKELACNDHYKFKSDPVTFYKVPADGDYVLAIHDAIYRGREDFVYRITMGELPFVTSIFPLGRRAGESPGIQVRGWNVEGAELIPPAPSAGPGIYPLAAVNSHGLVSNRVPFAVDRLPECLEVEPNHDPATAQKVKLPVIINGRVNRPDDTDFFQFTGKANQTIVAEVQARRLDSPLDSALRITDAQGKQLAFNDDHEDPTSGINTHDADSYLTAKLPANGRYFVQIRDTERKGGEGYVYRLRISEPQPDFDLRVTPSSAGLRRQGATTLTVYAFRKDGYTGPITVGVSDAESGFSATPVTLSGADSKADLTVRTRLDATSGTVNLIVEGRAIIGGKEVSHRAVPAEDRMQAFLWRHLVPARDLKVLVFDPRTLQRPAAALPRGGTDVTPPPAAPLPRGGGTSANPADRQTMRWLAGLTRLHGEGLLTDEFYRARVRQLQNANP